MMPLLSYHSKPFIFDTKNAASFIGVTQFSLFFTWIFCHFWCFILVFVSLPNFLLIFFSVLTKFYASFLLVASEQQSTLSNTKTNAWACIISSFLSFNILRETSCETLLRWKTYPHLLMYHTIIVFKVLKQNWKKNNFKHKYIFLFEQLISHII